MGLRQAGVTVLYLVLQVARDQARQHQLFHRSVSRTVEDTHHHRLLLQGQSVCKLFVYALCFVRTVTSFLVKLLIAI